MVWLQLKQAIDKPPVLTPARKAMRMESMVAWSSCVQRATISIEEQVVAL
jgi:hypothetical protein